MIRVEKDDGDLWNRFCMDLLDEATALCYSRT